MRGLLTSLVAAAPLLASAKPYRVDTARVIPSPLTQKACNVAVTLPETETLTNIPAILRGARVPMDCVYYVEERLPNIPVTTEPLNDGLCITLQPGVNTQVDWNDQVIFQVPTNNTSYRLEDCTMNGACPVEGGANPQMVTSQDYRGQIGVNLAALSSLRANNHGKVIVSLRTDNTTAGIAALADPPSLLVSSTVAGFLLNPVAYSSNVGITTLNNTWWTIYRASGPWFWITFTFFVVLCIFFLYLLAELIARPFSGEPWIITRTITGSKRRQEKRQDLLEIRRLEAAAAHHATVVDTDF